MTSADDDLAVPLQRGGDVAPEINTPPLEDAPEDAEETLRSLREDVEALIADGRTYLQSELLYQKTRAAFVADRGKSALVYGAAGALLGLLALIGLTVGLIIALTPHLTAWGASALVVGLLLLGAGLAVRTAMARWTSLMGAIGGDAGGKT